MESQGLRERKKLETHRRLSSAAQELVLEHGLDNVTIEEIAVVAGVSVRTFSNYFAGKDEAVVGVHPEVARELADVLRARPPEESPAAALRASLLADVDGMVRRWAIRNELVRLYPALLPRYLASMVQIEEAFTEAFAERAGIDPDQDPSPRAFVAASLAVVRATLTWWWESSDRTTPLLEVLDRAYCQLFPEGTGTR